ncbi:MAG: sulfotransferase [Chloroflexota bacterium]|jgi:hypothetical protein
MTNGPIFIGGPDRCGKTTMRAFLASHPNIAIPAVGSNMWTYFYGQYGDLADETNFERCLQDMVHYKHVAFLEPDADRIQREFRQGERSYARLFALFLVHFAERQGKPRWGAQTGLIERYADQIMAAYPGAQIVHMVRDPRDRYEASIARWPNGKLRAGGAVARWNYSVGLAQRNQARYPGRYLAVRYETMVTEPEETLRRLCDFLGEEYTTDMLIMAGAPDFRAKISQGAELAPNETPVTGDYIGLYKQGVPAQDVAFIQAYARRHMRAFGYAMKPVDFTLPERLRFNLLTRPKGLASMWFWLGLERGRQLFPDRLGPTPGSRMLLSQKKGEQQLSPASGAPAD